MYLIVNGQRTTAITVTASTVIHLTLVLSSVCSLCPSIQGIQELPVGTAPLLETLITLMIQDEKGHKCNTFNGL